MSAPIRIGTSGWIYKHWKGRFYPADLRQDDWLPFYAACFDTVEINYSFYRLPTRDAFAAWRARTPDGFCFAAKGSRFITHLKRLKEPEVHVPTFFERADALGDKLGPVLWQLPPHFHRNDERLDAFVRALPTQHPHAVEFRHASWLVEPVCDILRQHHIALCIADSHGASLPPEPFLTADWTYLRLHAGLTGGDYTEDQLRHWASFIADVHRKGSAAFVYFNNDWEGLALKNAARFRELI
jgi:uncharacterized protein YecE (DUF72 family)